VSARVRAADPAMYFAYAVLAYNMNTYELEAPAHPTERALTT
jgi:hypothetical protein